jgi:hypothetical protein
LDEVESNSRTELLEIITMKRINENKVEGDALMTRVV